MDLIAVIDMWGELSAIIISQDSARTELVANICILDSNYLLLQNLQKTQNVNPFVIIVKKLDIKLRIALKCRLR